MRHIVIRRDAIVHFDQLSEDIRADHIEIVQIGLFPRLLLTDNDLLEGTGLFAVVD